MEKRDLSVLPVRRKTNENGSIDVAMPTSLVKIVGVESLFFKIWEEKDLVNFLPDKGNREFPVTDKTKETYSKLFTGINEALLRFLKCSPDEFFIESFTISVELSLVMATARDIGRNRKFVADGTLDVEEFNTLIAENNEIVTLFTSFAWTFGQANDDELAKFS